MSDRIFISAATDEFGKLREKLAFALQRAGFEVEYQEIFPQTDAKTLSKLSKLLAPCRLVIHIVGQKAGAVANAKALEEFVKGIPKDTLLPEHAEVLTALGDLSGITYTQWEAFLALHHGVPLLVYAEASGWDARKKVVRDDFPQKEHLSRLKLASKYPEWCPKTDFALRILPDVSRELGVRLKEDLKVLDKSKWEAARTAFISHTTPDDGYVAELESMLRASGFDKVFNDVHSIRPDEEFWPEIEKGIRACDTFYVVISTPTKDSDWVRRELALARQLSKRIVPVWIEDCEVPESFAGRDVIDFRPKVRPTSCRKSSSDGGTMIELDELAIFPRALFAELLYHFDPDNAVPGGELSQRERAIELLKLVHSRGVDACAELTNRVAEMKGGR